jgi:hypothetical protein
MWNQVNYNQSHYANIETSAPYNHCSYPKVPCPHQRVQLWGDSAGLGLRPEEKGTPMARRHKEEDLPWWSSLELEKEGWGRDLTDMDWQNKWCDGIEEIETNLRVVAEFGGT